MEEKLDLILSKLERLVPDDKPMTVDEVSEYSGIAKAQLYQLTHRRLIRHYRIGKRLTFKKSDVDDFLFNQETLRDTADSIRAKYGS